MKKPLNTKDIANELAGASVYFSRSLSPAPAAPSSSTVPALQPEKKPVVPSAPGGNRGLPAAAQDISPMGEPGKQHALKQARVLARYPDSIIETIRKSVKDVGKEVTFVRLTREEKQQLADIAYTFKRQGMKTSENELGRIGINYLLADYKTTGKESIVARVIAALLA